MSAAFLLRVALVVALAFELEGCRSSGSPPASTDAGPGPDSQTDTGGGMGGSADAGLAGAGGTDGGNGACPSWPSCEGAGGRGNVCGGVIADERFMRGSGFEKWEGARVVGRLGHAVIEQGGFLLFVGSFSGCLGGMAETYRIDISANGHCDDDVDLVYTAESHDGIEPFRVTGTDPGTRGRCSDLPAGYDLDLTIAPACLPRCGAIVAGLFEAADQPLLHTFIYLDGSWAAGRGFGGAVVPGHQYQVRYFWVPSSFGSGCSTPPFWSGQRAVTAIPGLNSFEIAVDPKLPASACF
jgi:hypothetical protein